MRVRIRRKRRWLRWTVPALILLGLFVAIADPFRDFTTSHATLRPHSYPMASDELARSLRQAALRIRNWEYVGTARVDDSLTVVFERTSRVFRLKDDIVLHVEQRKDRSRLTGESRSRLDYGDLGQNPRNLRRILDELNGVLGEL